MNIWREKDYFYEFKLSGYEINISNAIEIIYV